ncbi:M48 family metallopeptidase [Sansalvadorimonas verongulae]|uniref:M48 family metallopeptidase n=1 Tax=Sansalvadorimonas verongulae TaxID=2172824 RepID=UPI0012BBBF96|nr:M48 family metallopeptidase [Sansalvadorimonas verongulae]MTI13549.1 M48 family peptidase [Sansalvadorimonas verongulae]
MLKQLRKLFLPVTLVSVGAFVTGCQSVHTTQSGAVGVKREQSMFMLLSEKQVEQISRESYLQMREQARKEKKLVSDGQTLNRLQTIADRLIAQVGVFRPDAVKWPWQVSLIEENTLNASCLPGGRIVFYTGIIETLKLTDDEIAAIMGHEMAHALREHGREGMSEAYMVQLGGTLAGSVLGASQETVGLANDIVHYAMTLPNSREKEAEADIIGLELMARAGYNPEAAVTLWQKMSAQNKQQPPEFLSTHPATDTRIDSLQQYMPKVQPLYQKAAEAKAS